MVRRTPPLRKLPRKFSLYQNTLNATRNGFFSKEDPLFRFMMQSPPFALGAGRKKHVKRIYLPEDALKERIIARYPHLFTQGVHQMNYITDLVQSPLDFFVKAYQGFQRKGLGEKESLERAELALLEEQRMVEQEKKACLDQAKRLDIPAYDSADESYQMIEPHIEALNERRKKKMLDRRASLSAIVDERTRLRDIGSITRRDIHPQITPYEFVQFLDLRPESLAFFHPNIYCFDPMIRLKAIEIAQKLQDADNFHIVIQNLTETKPDTSEETRRFYQLDKEMAEEAAQNPFKEYQSDNLEDEYFHTKKPTKTENNSGLHSGERNRNRGAPSGFFGKSGLSLLTLQSLQGIPSQNFEEKLSLDEEIAHAKSTQSFFAGRGSKYLTPVVSNFDGSWMKPSNLEFSLMDLARKRESERRKLLLKGNPFVDKVGLAKNRLRQKAESNSGQVSKDLAPDWSQGAQQLSESRDWLEYLYDLEQQQITQIMKNEELVDLAHSITDTWALNWDTKSLKNLLNSPPTPPSPASLKKESPETTSPSPNSSKNSDDILSWNVRNVTPSLRFSYETTKDMVLGGKERIFLVEGDAAITNKSSASRRNIKQTINSIVSSNIERSTEQPKDKHPYQEIESKVMAYIEENLVASDSEKFLARRRLNAEHEAYNHKDPLRTIIVKKQRELDIFHHQKADEQELERARAGIPKRNLNECPGYTFSLTFVNNLDEQIPDPDPNETVIPLINSDWSEEKFVLSSKREGRKKREAELKNQTKEDHRLMRLWIQNIKNQTTKSWIQDSSASIWSLSTPHCKLRKCGITKFPAGESLESLTPEFLQELEKLSTEDSIETYLEQFGDAELRQKLGVDAEFVESALMQEAKDFVERAKVLSNDELFSFFLDDQVDRYRNIL